MAEKDKGSVCVTGGTGYLASWLIMRLLQHGYTVHATIRSDPDRKKDVSYLTNLPGATERLRIFNADLDKPESFDEAIEGCVGVFHVAHIFDFEDKEPEEITTKRAVNGLLGIMQACLNYKTVKRVVYTSSAAAVMFNGKDLEVVDENSWTDVDLVRASNENEYKFLSNIPLVHVDDVASAHIFLHEYPNAKGRYVCSFVEITFNKMVDFLSARYPEYPIPAHNSLNTIEGVKYSTLSSKKLLDSGFKYKYGLEEMFDGAIQCCKQMGFL